MESQSVRGCRHLEHDGLFYEGNHRKYGEVALIGRTGLVRELLEALHDANVGHK